MSALDACELLTTSETHDIALLATPSRGEPEGLLAVLALSDVTGMRRDVSRPML